MVRSRVARPHQRAANVVLAGVVALAAVGVAVACEPAGCTASWSAAAPGAWTDASGWDTGSVPGASDVACIPAGSSVHVDGPIAVAGLKTAGTIDVTAGGSLSIAHSQIQGASTADVIVRKGASVSVGGGSGQLTLDGGELFGGGDVYASVSGLTGLAAGSPVLGVLGLLTIHGNLALDQTYVPIDLAGNGATPGVGHDRIAVTGTLSFTSNTLIDVFPAAGYSSSRGSTVSIFTASTVTGQPRMQTTPDPWGTGQAVIFLPRPTGIDLAVTQCDGATYFPGATIASAQAGKDLRYCSLPEAIVTGVNLTGTTLEGADLTDADLTGANLTNADLTGADLTGTDLTGATLTGVRSGGIVGTPVALPAGWQLRSGFLVGPGADFTDRNLTALDFGGLDLTGALFVRTQLGSADLRSTTLRGVRSFRAVGTPILPGNWQLRSGFLVGPYADLSRTNVSAADFSPVGGVTVDLLDADLTGADLTDADLTDVTLNQADLSGASLRRTNLGGAHLGFANLTGAVLTGTSLVGAFLNGANLTNATLTDVTLTGASIFNITVQGARGTHLTFDQVTTVAPGTGIIGGLLVGPGVNLSGQVFVLNYAGFSLAGANLVGARFSGAGLTGVPLTDADLTGATIDSCTLDGGSLRGANLTGALLARTSMDSVDMTGANLGPLAANPVDRHFGSELSYLHVPPTPPAGWVIVGPVYSFNFIHP